MKTIILIVFLTTASLVAHSSSLLTLNAQNLHDPNKKQLFIDAHNHTGGILPVLAVVDPYKFIRGQEPSETELKDFWFKLVKYYQDNETLKKNRNISNGTKLVLTCNEPSSNCALSDDDSSSDQCNSSLLNSLYNVFSATPLTAFATAYKFRGIVHSIPDLLAASSSYTQMRAKILAMAMTKAGIVELSQAFIGGSKGEESTFIFTKYKNIIDDLKATNTSHENQPLKERIQQLGLEVPSIKWLLLTHTLELGKISDETTLTYNTGQCSGMGMPEILKTDPATGLYDTLVNFEDVIGIDIAGPEITCFASEGMRVFKELATATYFASMTRRQNNNKLKKLVVRAHVGEGSPLLKTPFTEEQQAACDEIKKFPQLMKDLDQNLYIHQKEARTNISIILRAIADLKEKYSDIDDYIIFRLGHLTHLTNEQGQLMKSLNITADANLSSNISTQAWTQNPSIIDKYLVQKGISANHVRDLLDTLLNNGVSVGEIFDGHGLKWLLYHQVPTILGTDGAGVEHSVTLTREYEIAEKLINYWNENDEQFKSKNITIDSLLQSQKLHYDAMGYSDLNDKN